MNLIHIAFFIFLVFQCLLKKFINFLRHHQVYNKKVLLFLLWHDDTLLAPSDMCLLAYFRIIIFPLHTHNQEPVWKLQVRFSISCKTVLKIISDCTKKKVLKH